MLKRAVETKHTKSSLSDSFKAEYESTQIPLRDIDLNHENVTSTISPLREDLLKHTRYQNSQQDSSNQNNAFVISCLRDLKEDLIAVRNDLKDKDEYIAFLKHELASKQVLLERIVNKVNEWEQACPLEVVKEIQDAETNSILQEWNKTGKQVIFDDGMKWNEMVEAIYELGLSLDVALTELEQKLGVNTDNAGNEEKNDELQGPEIVLNQPTCESTHGLDNNKENLKLEEVLSNIRLITNRNLCRLKRLEKSVNQYPQVVKEYQKSLYEKDSVIEFQRAIIAVNMEQIANLKKQMVNPSPDPCKNTMQLNDSPATLQKLKPEEKASLRRSSALLRAISSFAQKVILRILNFGGNILLFNSTEEETKGAAEKDKVVYGETVTETIAQDTSESNAI